ncbi:YceD family protein [Nitratireductor basaltis]|uniref:Metal-binding protein n=1 Tax=Nitratireductor basaltis TaxID=472175 RepID=A0A084UBW1_9HYPH|nr:DUF177 domain-containing protein [Nitratireductor basaltis]KFB10447.1 hypothetical protein EL18_01482 [Nitratireductor basaltis]
MTTKFDHKTTSTSFPVQVNRLPARGQTVLIELDEKNRQQLAERHDLVAVKTYHAELLAKPWKREGVRVSGTLTAEIEQTCVVTLEPMTSRIETEVSGIFIPEGSRIGRYDIEGGEIVVEAEGEDIPETFTGDSVNVAQLVEEFFALEIDPYPRKPGASVPEPATEEVAEEEGAGPLYEQLKKLQNRH